MAVRPADAPPRDKTGQVPGGNRRPASGRREPAGGSRWRLRNWRLRTKITAVIVIPTLTALILGGMRAQVDLQHASALRHTVEQVRVAQTLTGLVHELQKERVLAVAWVASDKRRPRTELDTQIGLVDEAVEKARTATKQLDTGDPAAAQRYENALQRLTVLGVIRDNTKATAYPDVAVFTAYSSVLDAIVRLSREVNLTVTDRELLNEGTVVQAISDAKENIAEENAILQIAAARNEFPADTLRRIRDAEASASGAIANYRGNASAEQLQLYSDTVAGAEVDRRQLIMANAIARAQAAEGGGKKASRTSLGIDRNELTTTGAVTLEHLREVETKLLGGMRTNAEGLAAGATRSAVQDAVIVLVALLLALGLMALVTRSLLRPMRMLRREALEVAHRRLPATVKRILADPDPQQAARNAVEPVAVTTREETGQVARAFDVVQEQAVLMATEQALLRDNINSIFVNLSRRSQALVERQISLIDGLENDEQNPDQLAALFELDHLATRMRRYSESLLVLSGTGLSRKLSRPVAAADVVGAAVSEVEQYARVEVAPAPDVAVQGRAVSDLVHLIAELLDNATYFSEPQYNVVVRMAITRHGELGIQITDRGVGMSEQAIDSANRRLADPPDLDVAVTRRMGLYVVARLAKRHGITVHLRENEDIDGGVIARVAVPSELIRPIENAGTPPRTPSELPVRQPSPPPVPPAPSPAAPAPPAPLEAAPVVNGSENGAPAESNGAERGYYWQSGPEDTAPVPVDEAADSLPIYDAMVSQWFAAPQPAAQPESEAGPEPAEAVVPQPNGTSETDVRAEIAEARSWPIRNEWISPGDDGWLAAQALLDDKATRPTTTAGLPKRVPRAHLVPGSADTATAEPTNGNGHAPRPAPAPSPVEPAPKRAEAVRGRMSRFQEGVRRGRHAVVEANNEATSGLAPDRRGEEQE